MILVQAALAGSYPKIESEYAAILARATALGYTKPSSAQQVKQNEFLKALKTAGIWSRLDHLLVMAQDGSKEFGTLNWINPNINQATFINTVTWTSNHGFKGDGGSSYTVTGFDVTAGVNYTQNDASRGLYYFGTPVLEAALAGSQTSSRETMTYSVTSTSQRINQGTSATTAFNTTASPFLNFNRTASNILTHFVGTTSYARTTPSVAMVSDQITLGRISTSTYSTSEISLLWHGSNLVSQNSDLYNAVTTYMGSL